MINTNVTKRYSAKECLEHEWFLLKHDEHDKSISTINTEFISNLKLIRSKTIMQNVAYKFVKKIMNQEDLETLHEKFAEVSAGKDEIPILQFKQVLEDYSVDFTNNEITKLVNDILKTQDLTGKINYVDLLAELDNISEYNQDTKIWMIFNKFSDDDSGCVSHTQIKEALKSFDIEKTDDELKDMLLINNIQEKDDIDFEQFKALINHKSKPA